MARLCQGFSFINACGKNQKAKEDLKHWRHSYNLAQQSPAIQLFLKVKYDRDEQEILSKQKM